MKRREVWYKTFFRKSVTYPRVLNEGCHAYNLFECFSQCSRFSCNSISGEKTVFNSKQSQCSLSLQYSIHNPILTRRKNASSCSSFLFALLKTRVSQASTSSQDIHAVINFTDPRSSSQFFETTSSVLSLKILINTNSPRLNLLNN